MNPRVISASRRTDIPAFYTPWFLNRLRAGFCFYPNPRFPQQFHRVSLLPPDVLGLVFWTRHAAPLLPHLDELDRAGFPYYFQYTVTGYPRTIERHTPPTDTAVQTFAELSRRVGAARVIWRYDPLLLCREVTPAWQHDNFRRLADALAPFTQRVVVSVVDPYVRTQRRLGRTADGVQYALEAYTDLISLIVAEAQARNLCVHACAESALSIAGITPSRCVDAELLYALRGATPPARVRLHRQREGCLCHASVDIGVNDSCGFGCRYCYATNHPEQALATIRRHDPAWNCLTQDVVLDPRGEGDKAAATMNRPADG
jgi:hypothetical protein